MYISSDPYTQRGALHVDSVQPCEDSMRTYTRHAQQTSSPTLNLLCSKHFIPGSLGRSPLFRLDFAAEFGPLSLDPNQRVRRSIRAKAHGTSTAREVRRRFLPSSPRPPTLRRLRHDAEHGVVTADAGPDLLIVLLGVAHLVKLGLRDRKTALQLRSNAAAVLDHDKPPGVRLQRKPLDTHSRCQH